MGQYKCTIEGLAPLKMDRWTDLAPAKNEDGYIKQAEEKCYRDEKGNVAIPAAAIKAAMRYASSDVGKKMAGKKNRQTIASGVFIEPEMISLGKKTHDGIARDIVTRAGTGNKVTRVPTYRPMIKKWKIDFIINSYEAQPEFIKECLSIAGTRYGLLGHRPEFGRFIVTSFEKLK